MRNGGIWTGTTNLQVTGRPTLHPEQSCNERDGSLDGKNNLAATVPSHPPINAGVEEDRPRSDSTCDPCASVCRFPNPGDNCWMNATLQAVLNLEVVQRKLTSLHPEHVIQKLITPAFGGLFLTALLNPGGTFGPEVIKEVLTDLSLKLPSLKLSQANHICHFLNPLLMSLNRCDVNTRVEIEELSSCERCLINMWSREEKYVFILPAPGENDSITSLWIRSEVEHEEVGRCVSCGLTVKKEFSMVLPEVLTICVPQEMRQDSVVSRPVTPCASLEFLMDESTTLSYRLASVICKGDLEGRVGHAWTCLFKNHHVVEANDELVSVVKSCRPDSICQGGIYYFYERSK